MCVVFLSLLLCVCVKEDIRSIERGLEMEYQVVQR